MLTGPPPEISIITPTLNQFRFLRRCCASVADQHPVPLEHIVVDGGSSDGTREWLRTRKDIHSVCEQDESMYDALNKGFRMARGRLVAYLNSDEQYLPGALSSVLSEAARHPAAGLFYGDALIVDENARAVAFKKTFPLRWPYVYASYLYAYSCAIFFRRSSLGEGDPFDASLRAVADARLIVRLLREGHSAIHMPRYLAAFAVTGENLSWSDRGLRELRAFRKAAPPWVRMLRLPLAGTRILEQLLRGAFSERFPLTYALYGDPPAVSRVVTHAERLHFSFAPDWWTRTLLQRALLLLPMNHLRTRWKKRDG